MIERYDKTNWKAAWDFIEKKVFFSDSCTPGKSDVNFGYLYGINSPKSTRLPFEGRFDNGCDDESYKYIWPEDPRKTKK
jgi:hypothetical protein